jgi:hypothetical protein
VPIRTTLFYLAVIDIPGSILSLGIKEGIPFLPLYLRRGQLTGKDKTLPALHPMNKANYRNTTLYDSPE